MFQSLKKIFASETRQNQELENKDIDILAGILIEAANTDGKVTQDEINQISSSLTNVFKENPEEVMKVLSKALDYKDNSDYLHHLNKQKVVH